MITEKEKQYKESILHKSHSVPVSVHTTRIEAASSQEKTAEKSFNALYLHWHSELEFFVVESGELEIFIENHAFSLKAGEGIFIPPMLLHWARACQNVVFHAAVADPLWLVSSYNTEVFHKYIQPICTGSVRYAVALTSREKWQNEILQTLEPIFSMDEEQIAAKELFVQGAFLMIWQQLYDGFLKQQFPDKKHSPAHLEHLQKSVSYIEEHYMEDITLEKMAEQVHLSRGQFCRLFQAWTGISPFCYLNRCRILNSSRLLASSQKKISEIASQCGFNSISYFNRTFLKLTGMTPSAYRNQISRQKGKTDL